MSLAGELLKQFEQVVQSIALVPSDEGRFEVTVNGQLLYSKLATNRHAQPGEIAGLIAKLAEG